MEDEAYLTRQRHNVLPGRVIIHNKVAFACFQALLAASTSHGRSNLFYICIHKLLNNCLLLLYLTPTRPILQSLCMPFIPAPLHIDPSRHCHTRNITHRSRPLASDSHAHYHRLAEAGDTGHNGGFHSRWRQYLFIRNLK